MRILADAERVLVEQDAPLLPLSHFRTVYMYDPVHLRGIARNPRLEQQMADLHRTDAPAVSPAP